MKKSVIIIISVITALVVATGLGVLIWWLVTRNVDSRFENISLEGEGLGDVSHRAGFTRIPDNGDMFWWFYPALVENSASRPLVLWLDGVVGVAPSLMANLGLFGPYDLHLNRRNNSWVTDYNLLFVDAPLGSGFSKISEQYETPSNLSDTTVHLLYTLESFYLQNNEYSETPLFIFGQGYGAQLAIYLANSLRDYEIISPNLKGIVLGNPIISPALVLTKLGFYLEELGYIDFKGRDAIENYVKDINDSVSEGQLRKAYEKLLNLDEFIDEQTGAVAINLGHIVEKLNNGDDRDYFGQLKYLQEVTGFTGDIKTFMDTEVAPALGISEPNYNVRNEDIIDHFGESFMVPAVDKVEEILSDTNLTVAIYNSNLDAISNTPGQLEWINNLNWPGQQEFSHSARQTLVINRLIEGYFRETERLTFYWINVAGLLVNIVPLAVYLA